MNKIDIQNGSARGFDVIVNGDHYETVHTHDDAIASAREAAGSSKNVVIRDMTRPIDGAKWTEVSL